MPYIDIMHTFIENDTDCNLLVSLVDPFKSNAAVNLTSCTVTMMAEPQRGTGGSIGPISGAIVGVATAGVVRFDCATIVAAGEDIYKLQIKRVNASSKVKRAYTRWIAVEKEIA